MGFFFGFLNSLIGLAALGLLTVSGLAMLLVLLVIVAARLPADNPLRRILHAVSLRLATMLGVGAVAVPIQPIPGIDVAVDAGAIALGMYLTYTFFRELHAIWKDTQQPRAIGVGAVDVRQEPAAPERQVVSNGRQLRSGTADQEPRRLGR